jgi:hypothetical protein
MNVSGIFDNIYVRHRKKFIYVIIYQSLLIPFLNVQAHQHDSISTEDLFWY